MGMDMVVREEEIVSVVDVVAAVVGVVKEAEVVISIARGDSEVSLVFSLLFILVILVVLFGGAVLGAGNARDVALDEEDEKSGDYNNHEEDYEDGKEEKDDCGVQLLTRSLHCHRGRRFRQPPRQSTSAQTL